MRVEAEGEILLGCQCIGQSLCWIDAQIDVAVEAGGKFNADGGFFFQFESHTRELRASVLGCCRQHPFPYGGAEEVVARGDLLEGSAVAVSHQERNEG